MGGNGGANWRTCSSSDWRSGRGAHVARGLAQALPQRQAHLFGAQVPQRRVEQTHCAGALAVATLFFAAHQHRHTARRVDQALVIAQRLGGCGQQARDEALAQQAAFAVAANRVKRQTHQGFAADRLIGADDQCRRGHLVKSNRGVAHRRANRQRGFVDGDDLHARGPTRPRACKILSGV